MSRTMISADALKTEILAACSDASKTVSAQLKRDIKINIPSVAELSDVTRQWGSVPFDWRGNEFSDNSSVCTFKLAVRARSRICGLVSNAFEKEKGYNAIILEKIQGSPDKNHPLKGLIVAAFSVVNLEIEKRIKAERIYVENPVEDTLPLYARLGYRTGYFIAGGVHEAELYVFPESSIKWPTLQR